MSKNAKASDTLNAHIEVLLQLAARAPNETFAKAHTEAKLYEVKVACEVLKQFRSSAPHRTVNVISPPGAKHKLVIPGNGCSHDPSKFTYFELMDNGAVVHELWLSLRFTTLSWERANAPLPMPLSSYHELDVSVIRPRQQWQPAAQNFEIPSYVDLCAGFSCKHTPAVKAQVREALGLRRETAFLCYQSKNLAPWLGFGSHTPARPASLMVLASSSMNIKSYKSPIDLLGVTIWHVAFP